MAVLWDKYHVLLDRVTGKLLIGRGEITKSGKMNWSSKSDDRTEEIIKQVSMKMRNDVDKRKDGRPYVGYNIPRFGTLLFVKAGYTFTVRKR